LNFDPQNNTNYGKNNRMIRKLQGKSGVFKVWWATAVAAATADKN